MHSLAGVVVSPVEINKRTFDDEYAPESYECKDILLRLRLVRSVIECYVLYRCVWLNFRVGARQGCGFNRGKVRQSGVANNTKHHARYGGKDGPTYIPILVIATFVLVDTDR